MGRWKLSCANRGSIGVQFSCAGLLRLDLYHTSSSTCITVAGSTAPLPVVGIDAPEYEKDDEEILTPLCDRDSGQAT